MSMMNDFEICYTSIDVALQRLEDAEKAMNDLIYPSIIRMAEQRDVEGLLELIDTLPKGYKGVRKIYQIIGDIEQEKT